MYNNTYSDYAANKTDAEAIVCRSATGEDVRLTRADFESDEEFQRWKGWSDADYKQSERRDRAYNDRRLSLAAAYFLSDKELNECFSGELKAGEQRLRDDLVSRILIAHGHTVQQTLAALRLRARACRYCC